MNILLEPEFQTLHGTAPFSRIKVEDYEPAFIEAMKQEDEAIEAIVNNPEPDLRKHDSPTYWRNAGTRQQHLLQSGQCQHLR